MKEKLIQLRTQPLPSTYVTAAESRKREKWFNDFKYPILDQLTMKQEGGHENKKLDFADIQSAISFFKTTILNLKSNDDGVRVYFSSPASDGSINNGKCGKLTIVFVPTKFANNEELLYYKFDKGTFIQTDLADAVKGIHNYQLLKRDYLFNSLSYNDRLDGNKETKHIWFSLDQMQQTIKEMEDQQQAHGNIVKGFGIRFVAYTNKDYLFLTSKPPIAKRRQRLTICFTFIDANGNDIGIQEINPAEFNERLRVTKQRMLDDTFDTGVPAPPPPGETNKAPLDCQM